MSHDISTVNFRETIDIDLQTQIINFYLDSPQNILAKKRSCSYNGKALCNWKLFCNGNWLDLLNIQGNEQAKTVNSGPLAPHVKPMLGRFGKGVKYNSKWL